MKKTTVHLRPEESSKQSRENGVSESGNSSTCKGPEVGKKCSFCWKKVKKASEAGIGA